MAYFGNESAVPTMTSYNTPSGIVTWSSESTASSSYKGWNVFARNTTFWQSGNVASAWVAYQFPTEKRIAKYTLEAGAYPNAAPKTWTFEGSNDGLAWDVLDTQTTTQTWAVGTKRQYSINNLKSYLRYRVNVSSNMVSDAYSVCITNIEMFEMFYSNKILLSLNGSNKIVKDTGYKSISAIPILTSDTSSPLGVASSSGTVTGAWKAFDGVQNIAATDDGWMSLYNATSGWLRFDFVSKKKIRAYGLKAHNYTSSRNAKNWTFEGSNDNGNTWVVLDKQEDFVPAKWISGIWLYFELKDYSKDFLSYRLNISSNNGATYTAVGEMVMLESNDPLLIQLPNVLNENHFIKYGALSIDVTKGCCGVQNINNELTPLGEGKIFTHTVDMSKRQINKINLS
ncbi:hypothetical protein BSK59_33220 [Paenibacillus odorifer]|uniref:hypothetical protein n=1 Tax=Paenibacillus odorifer TaxID=189426 RepID=UPI00096F0226|nr:hypothetical protein [Paenibacillus odorifer]OME44711.1 hypothetical protein BSK59_33220 [Paenibacillus odorifer]